MIADCLFALCLALAPLAAAAQKAAAAQTDAVSAVAECLAVGLPEEWKRLQVIIELKKPFADTGGVLYLVTAARRPHRAVHSPATRACRRSSCSTCATASRRRSAAGPS